jgi:hypothetical protein
MPNLKWNPGKLLELSGREFLSKDSAKYLGHVILHHHHLLDLGGGPGTYAIHFCWRRRTGHPTPCSPNSQ